MSSLKQRAMQCSGHIPASQYVPVYSRPHRTNQGRWHEEIAPITPKPILDDPYTGRTQSIHEAVKLWLDSSPNSVIGPLYRSRSPSSGSPPSNGESTEQQQQQQAVASSGPGDSTSSDTSHLESNNDRFYDVGSGGLSPQQVSIEQSVVLASGSSASSPRPAGRADKSTPKATVTNRAHNVGAAGLPLVQKNGAKSPVQVLAKEDDEKSSASDTVEPSSPKDPGVGNQASAPAEEGKNNAFRKRRGGRKRSITELKSSDEDHVHGLSVGSLSDFNSRAVSGEFDMALALVVNEIDTLKPFDTLSCVSDYSSVVGTPNVHLKPPRGLEKNVAHDADQNLAMAELSLLPRAASARQDRNSEIITLPPPLPRATSAREDQSSAFLSVPQPLPRATSAREDQSAAAMRVSPPPRATSAREDQSSAVTRVLPLLPQTTRGKADQSSAVTKVPLFYRLGSTAADTTGVADGAKANSNPEIIPVDHPEVVEDGDKENISEANQSKQRPPEQRKLGFRASLTKIDEVGSKSKSPDSPPRLTIQAVLQNEEKLAALQSQQTKMNASDSSPVVISNGVAAVAGGYEFRHERSSRRTESNHSEGGSVANAPNSVPEQHIYKVSPLRHIVSKVNRSKKQNSPSPAESQRQLRRDKSNKSVEREASPKVEPLDKAKLEELRLKADAWENAKNATILSRYKREESKIFAWEEKKVAKATVTLSKIESDLEKKAAKAAEKMQYEVAETRKKAAEMKAHAEAKRAERAAKAAVQAQLLRVMGRSPLSCFCS